MYMAATLIVNLSDDPIVNGDLEAVVRCTVNEFVRFFSAGPPAGARPIYVFYRPECPITDSTTDPKVYRIGLTVRDRFYCQLVFQLGHELCHIFADPRRSNWFVECCCEMVSLVLLNRVSKVWANTTPFPDRVSYALKFQRYAEDRIRRATTNAFRSDFFPDHAQLRKWLTIVSALFRKNHATIKEM